MPVRVLNVFVMLVLVWSGFATHEQFRSPTAGCCDAVAFVSNDVTAGEQVMGSVADHHLDDVPAQPQWDPPGDSSAPFQALARPPYTGGATSGPPRYRDAAEAAPWLAGLWRPPTGPSPHPA